MSAPHRVVSSYPLSLKAALRRRELSVRCSKVQRDNALQGTLAGNRIVPLEVRSGLVIEPNYWRPTIRK
jgi:hypothetical protein